MLLEWIEHQIPSNTDAVQHFHQRFGLGESEALALAIKLQSPILVDEVKVIQEARKHRLKVFSTLQMLLAAKAEGFISSVKPELDEYMKTGFRLSEKLYNHVVALAREK
ncbi:MAG: DUF3368 domain-containing protein [Ignavibacteriae bacterium]|nr:DUF3368 domain-containing protein [Ignavibacteriota bacterium]